RGREVDEAARAEVDASILEVVRDARPAIGRTRVAEVLRGGRSQRLVANGWDGLPAYGRHADVRAGDVLARVDALIEAGELVSSGGHLPVLDLAEDGAALGGG
ncbi:RQC domain-containing protein, partial [Patulibacter sp. S7RM1-6]